MPVFLFMHHRGSNGIKAAAELRCRSFSAIRCGVESSEKGRYMLIEVQHAFGTAYTSCVAYAKPSVNDNSFFMPGTAGFRASAATAWRAACSCSCHASRIRVRQAMFNGERGSSQLIGEIRSYVTRQCSKRSCAGTLHLRHIISTLLMLCQ